MVAKRKTKKITVKEALTKLQRKSKDADLTNTAEVKNLFKDYKPNTSSDQYNELVNEIDNVSEELRASIKSTNTSILNTQNHFEKEVENLAKDNNENFSKIETLKDVVGLYVSRDKTINAVLILACVVNFILALVGIFK